MPDLRDIKTCQHKIKNDSAKIIKEVQIGIQSIDVEGLKSDLSSTYEAVKQTVKETGKAVKSEEHENQSAELKDKLKRIFIKVKPVLKSKVVLVAIGVIVVTVSFGNMISNHKKLEEIYYNNYNAYQSFVRNSSKNIRSVEEAYEDLFNSLDRIEELKEAKKSYRSVLDGEERAARRLEKEYGKDSMAFELAYAFGYEPAYDDWAKVTDELYDLVEACANREEMLKETRRSLYDMKESLHKIIDNVEPYKNNNEFFFKGILSDVNREIKNNKLRPTIEKINRCLEVCELYGDLAAERYMGYR